LARLGEKLLISARAGDPPDVCPSWNEFEQGLLAHLEAEEVELLPHFEAGHRLETDALRLEHARIRHLVDKMGLSVELHEAKADALEELLRIIREHSAREENLLYRWTDKNLPPPLRARLLARLRRTVSQASPAPRPSEAPR
jgi:hypothetical protein